MKRVATILPATLVALLLASVYGVLLLPGRALATRDVPQFHLPLRSTLAALAREGLPEWNPFLQGGQPLLSDPSYSAFYPPTWLILLAPAHFALGLLIVLHAGLAAWGAYRLARRLGCRGSVAGIAASGFACGGAFASLTHAFTLLPGMSWFPWALDAADRLAAAPDLRAARGPFAASVAVLAAVALNGEPATLLSTAFAMVVVATLRLPTRPGRALAAGLVAAGVAAIQLAPAVVRLALSPRAGGLGARIAESWSMSPLRFVELVVPRLLGDPTRLDGALFFGFGLHDFDYPYVLVLTPGLPLVLFGVVAIAARPIPRRAAWATLALAGALLALGRHAPLLAWAMDWLPGFSAVRFPEKYFLLTHAALVFAGALGLEHALGERERGRKNVFDLPVALAALALAVCAAFAAGIFGAPERVRDFIVAHSGLIPTEKSMASAFALYRGEAIWGVALAAAVLAVLVVARAASRPAAAAIAAALWALLAGELVRLSAPLVTTLPAERLAQPSPLAAAALASVAHPPPGTGPMRIWSSADVDHRPELILVGPQGIRTDMLARIERGDPAVGAIWGLRYALSVDSALTLTPPAARARQALEALWSRRDRERVHRLLGAWSAGTILVKRGPAELLRASAAGEDLPAPADLAVNPRFLPFVRTVAAGETFPYPETALGAALAAGLPLAEREYLIGDRRAPAVAFDAAARARLVEDGADRLLVRVASKGPALLVVSTTYDRNWSAQGSTGDLPVVETAAGYLAIPVPAGGGDVRLVYRDPWLRVGAAGTLLTLLGAAFAGMRPGRRVESPGA